jgi:hypothetical protein
MRQVQFWQFEVIPKIAVYFIASRFAGVPSESSLIAFCWRMAGVVQVRF